MKKISHVTAILLLLLALSASIAGAQTIPIPSLYVDMSDVQLLCGRDTLDDPLIWVPEISPLQMPYFDWQPHDSSLIRAMAFFSTSLRFDVTSGADVEGQDAYFSGLMEASNWFHGIRFGWQSSLSSLNAGTCLQLQVWGFRQDETAPSIASYDMLGAIVPGAGTHSGHWTVLFPSGYNQVEIHLAAVPVPEPSSLAALACGLAGMGRYARRRASRPR